MYINIFLFILQAEACRSIHQAMKKCPNGFYAEIKYDGERVQLHKKGSEFQYFSRSLKPVLPHKVTPSFTVYKMHSLRDPVLQPQSEACTAT